MITFNNVYMSTFYAVQIVYIVCSPCLHWCFNVNMYLCVFVFLTVHDRLMTPQDYCVRLDSPCSLLRCCQNLWLSSSPCVRELTSPFHLLKSVSRQLQPVWGIKSQRCRGNLFYPHWLIGRSWIFVKALLHNPHTKTPNNFTLISSKTKNKFFPFLSLTLRGVFFFHKEILTAC